ncbi:MAG: 2-dehydropantoate 2-reductase [Rhodovibrionaceae bacterium]
MKICVFGAGAIGGYIGAELALAGEAEVTLIARGPHLAAMRENGLKLLIGGEEKVAQVNCTDDPSDAGPQDYVIVALKAHSVPGAVDAMQPLLGKDTAVVTAQNGVPWWYFYKLEGDHENRRLESVDPGGTLWDKIGPERAIGCVVYPACELAEPGVVKHIASNRFPLGEPSGEKTERLLALSKAMVAANLKAPVRPRIRDDIWIKLWGNLSFNPISALTGATLDAIVEDEGTHAVVRAMMLEAQAIGEKLGVKFPIDVERRIAGAGEVGEHKTSMLQDLESGRPMEIDALVAAVQELGRLVEVSTPAIDTVLALVRQRATIAGCYG